MADAPKPLHFEGSSREDLSAFPPDAKMDAGYQLWRVQNREDPNHWKPMPTVGPGTVEIIINTGDAYRVFYVAKFDDGIHVLHAFQKTTEKTSKKDIDTAVRRYRALVQELKAGKKKGRR